ncbi:peptidylprolyl isomerase [Thalassospira australica]
MSNLAENPQHTTRLWKKGRVMSEQVRASHILLMYAGSARSSATRTKEEALTEINALKEQIANGADFGEVAKANSDCPSGQQGGDLGFFGRGMMVPEFDAAAFNMEVGTTSDVVETDFGYHLLQRTA